MANTNNFTDDEIEVLHVLAMVAMNGMMSNGSYVVSKQSLYPERIANDSYAIAEAMILRSREYHDDI